MLSPWVSLIFASWQGYADTLSLVHFARQESATLQVVSTNQFANLPNLYLSTSEWNNSSLTTQLLIRTCLKFRPQWNWWTTTLPLSCSNIVKTYDCMFFLESDCISSRFCTLIFGSFYSPTPPGWWLWVVFGPCCIFRCGETWNKVSWACDCAKITLLLVGNPRSWTKSQNKVKYRWQDPTQGKNCSVPGNSLAHIFPEAICCHGKLLTPHTGNFQVAAMSCKTTRKSTVNHLECKVFPGLFVVAQFVVVALWFWQNAVPSTTAHGRMRLDHSLANSTHWGKEANNPKTPLTWQEQRLKVCLQFVCFFVACVPTQNISIFSETISKGR